MPDGESVYERALQLAAVRVLKVAPEEVMLGAPTCHLRTIASAVCASGLIFDHMDSEECVTYLSEVLQAEAKKRGLVGKRIGWDDVLAHDLGIPIGHLDLLEQGAASGSKESFAVLLGLDDPANTTWERIREVVQSLNHSS